MSDVFTVAKLLMDNVVKNYGQEVDIIAYYGSRARGDSRNNSDLDIFYIPADGKNPPVGRTFLFNGLLFDFWAIRWDTLEGFATGRIRGWAFAPALVHQAKIMYSRSDEQVSRLEKLKEQILDLQKPESQPQMVKRALGNFGNVSTHLSNLRLAVANGNQTDVRFAGWKVVQSVWECLALANQVFFERGLGKGLSETAKFKDKPDELDQLIKTIIMAPDLNKVLEASEQLTQNTRQILRRIQKTILSNSSVREQFQQAYPEMKDMISKLLAACENGDNMAANAEAFYLQSDVTSMLYQATEKVGNGDFNLLSELSSSYHKLGFPDLLKFVSGDLKELSKQAKLFDEKLRSFLENKSVDLCEFSTIDELSNSLQRNH